MNIAEALRGTRLGRMQSVGPMDLVPILGDQWEDASFAPPTEVFVSNRNYGHLAFDNRAERPTIIPTNAGYVTKQAAQDHAIASAVVVKARAREDVNDAACIQSSQCGHIRSDRYPMLVLPVQLRGAMLNTKGQSRYNKLWPSIQAFNETLAVRPGRAHLSDFLTAYEDELDSFVAQFELVPRMRGAIILVNGGIAGVELAPNEAYWQAVWVPLIRVCYGALALEAGRGAPSVPSTRVPLRDVSDLDDLLAALQSAEDETERLAREVASRLGRVKLIAVSTTKPLRGYSLRTVRTGKRLGGQLLEAKGAPGASYASLCLA